MDPYRPGHFFAAIGHSNVLSRPELVPLGTGFRKIRHFDVIQVGNDIPCLQPRRRSTAAGIHGRQINPLRQAVKSGGHAAQLAAVDTQHGASCHAAVLDQFLRDAPYKIDGDGKAHAFAAADGDL